MVSVVISTFNRPALLENTLQSMEKQAFRDYEVVVVDDGTDTETKDVCSRYTVRYFRLNRPQDRPYKNPAVPNNIGIRKAQGDIVILQNAECRHESPEVIKTLSGRATGNNAVLASVLSLNADGTSSVWYCHPKHSKRPFFFCGALRKEWFEKLGGFDEDFTSYGYEDDDFSQRLTDSGVVFEWTEDILVHHQWHGPSNNEPSNSTLYAEKQSAYQQGKIGLVRNVGHEWGSI